MEKVGKDVVWLGGVVMSQRPGRVLTAGSMAGPGWTSVVVGRPILPQEESLPAWRQRGVVHATGASEDGFFQELVVRNRGSCPGRELANRGRSTATPGPGGTGGRGAQSHLWLKLQWSPTGRGQWPFLAWSQQSQELHGHQ